MEFIEITPENYDEAKRLNVRPEQRKYVASIKDTLADAFVYKESQFRLVKKDGIILGYILIYPYEIKGKICVNIVRMAIDKNYQGKGLGRLLLRNIVQWIKDYYDDVSKIRISTMPENKLALKLYMSEGFEKTGIEENEIALYMDTDCSE